MKTGNQLKIMLNRMGSDVVYHREDSGTACPCLTPEGFRDPAWHRAHPDEPVCNEQGILATVVEFTVKALVQPVQMGNKRASQQANPDLADLLTDDKVGVFPCVWNGHTLNFDRWSEVGNDFIVYDGKSYIVVAHDKVADVDGDPNHHYEVGLREVATRG